MNEPTAAARVWGTPELRSLIINEMDIAEVRKSLCLTKTTFPDMVRVLYRQFHYKNYAGLYKLSVPYLRRNLYIESIRSLQIAGKVTEIKDVSHHNGLSQLLDTFPLATEIIVGNGNHRLVTPPRLLVDPSHPQPSAELHVKVLLKSGAADLPLLIRVYPKLRAFDCVVVYTITIGSDCRIDWDLSMWGRMVIPGKTALASWPPEDGTPLAQSIVIPFCVIHDREIHSMTIKQSIDLETLSKHLEQRRQMGWGDIKRWDVRVTSFSALPQFLSLNRQVTELTIRRSGALPINIAGFLTLDWSPLRRTIQNPHHGLEDLTIRLDFSRACAGNIGHRIRTIMESGNRSPVFGLKTLVLLIETGTVAKKAIASLPPYSQIAKLFVGIYGHHFELKIEMAEVGAVEGPFIECLRSQLVKGGRAPTREGKEKNGIRVVMPWFT